MFYNALRIIERCFNLFYFGQTRRMSSIYESRLASQDVPFSPQNPNLRSSMPFSSSKIFSHSRLPSESFGILNQFSLADLIDPNQISLRNSQVQVLASTKNKKIQFTDAAQHFFDQYRQNPIAFIAVYGKNNAGKSFWCDKTYDLADVANKPNYQEKSTQSIITFSTTPFTKGNIKIFMLDCSGFDHQDLRREEQLRLDTIMLLSSVVVLMPDPSDRNCSIMKTAVDHFQESQKRLRYNGYPAQKRSAYWPHSLYTLYRTTQPVNKDMEKLGELFYDYNFSIIFDAKSQKLLGKDIDISRASFLDTSVINQHYMKHVSWVFRDIYEKIQAKKLGKLRLNGGVTKQIIHGINNQLNHNDRVDTEKIIKYATKSLYEKSLKTQTGFYVNTLSASMDNNDKQSLSLSELYEKMKSAREQTLESYDKESKFYDPSSPEAEQCQAKLLEFIIEREKLLERKNIENTQKFLQEKLPHARSYNISKGTDLEPFLMDLKSTNPELEHGRSEIVGSRLKQASQINKDKIFMASEEQIKLSQLQQKVFEKKRQLDEIQNGQLLKNDQNRKVEEELKVLRTKNSQLEATLKSRVTKDNLEREDGDEGNGQGLKSKKIKQLNLQRDQLASRLKESEQQFETHSKWMQNRDHNILGETLVSELVKKVEQKKINGSRVQKSAVDMSRSTIGAEKRNLNEEGIRKYRHVRR